MKQNTQNQFNPNQEAVLTYVPDFQDKPFTVTGLGEALLPIAEAVERSQTAQTVKDTVELPKAPQTAPETAYVDFSALPSRILARKRLQARVFDLLHRTDMYGALTERIEDDRSVAFARNLGILGVTRCAKHEKAVGKLRNLVH